MNSAGNRPKLNKWWAAAFLVAIAMMLNVGLYIRVILYGP